MSRKTTRELQEERLDSVRGGVQEPDGSCREPGPACDQIGGVQLNPETSSNGNLDAPDSVF